jgi:hypothetical protein
MKKEYDGLGVPELKDLNLCLLGSWVKRYIRDEGKLWREIIDRKYYRRGNIFCSDRRHASPFWKCVILIAQAIKHGYRWVVGDGTKIRFWEDSWFGSTPLAVQFWELYCVCNEKTITIAEVWVDGELRLTFRRMFSYQMMQSWDDLISVVENMVLSDESDALVWCYESSGITHHILSMPL